MNDNSILPTSIVTTVVLLFIAVVAGANLTVIALTPLFALASASIADYLVTLGGSHPTA